MYKSLRGDPFDPNNPDEYLSAQALLRDNYDCGKHGHTLNIYVKGEYARGWNSSIWTYTHRGIAHLDEYTRTCLWGDFTLLVKQFGINRLFDCQVCLGGKHLEIACEPINCHFGFITRV